MLLKTEIDPEDINDNPHDLEKAKEIWLVNMGFNETYVKKSLKNTDYNVEKALILLKKGMSVREVSEECGYVSPSAFTTAFKREYGYSPKSIK